MTLAWPGIYFLSGPNVHTHKKRKHYFSLHETRDTEAVTNTTASGTCRSLNVNQTYCSFSCSWPRLLKMKIWTGNCQAEGKYLLKEKSILQYHKSSQLHRPCISLLSIHRFSFSHIFSPFLCLALPAPSIPHIRWPIIIRLKLATWLAYPKRPSFIDMTAAHGREGAMTTKCCVGVNHTSTNTETASQLWKKYVQ